MARDKVEEVDSRDDEITIRICLGAWYQLKEQCQKGGEVCGGRSLRILFSECIFD